MRLGTHMRLGTRIRLRMSVAIRAGDADQRVRREARRALVKGLGQLAGPHLLQDSAPVGEGKTTDGSGDAAGGAPSPAPEQQSTIATPSMPRPLFCLSMTSGYLSVDTPPEQRASFSE